MKRLGAAIIALLALALIVAAPARAAESIESLRVDASVQADGTLVISETIVYDFDGEERRGIIRDIPTVDVLEDGRTWNYSVSIIDITADDAPVPWTIDATSPYLVVRIGDPDLFVTGSVTYRISYEVTGALRTLTAEDVAAAGEPDLAPGDVELFWDFIGSTSEVVIREGVASVRGPGAPLAARCFTGPVGGTEGCPVALGSDAVRLGPATVFPGESLTGVIAFPADAFTAVPAPDIREPDPSQSIVPSLRIGLLVGAMLPVVLVGAALVMRRWARGVVIPLTPVRFGPPDDLRPAELAAARDGKVDSTALIATLLDLTARRHITVAINPGGLFGRDQLLIGRWGAGTDTPAPWEQRILDATLGDQQSVALGGYSKTLAAAVGTMSTSLTQAAQSAGRRNPQGDRIRRWLVFAIIGGIILAAASLFLGVILSDLRFFGFGIVAAIGLIVGAWIALLITPRRQTRQSATFLAELAGFRRFLDTDPAEARRDLAKRLGLPDHAVFATMLPYAVVLKLEDRWMGAFPDLTTEELNGMGLFVPSVFAIHDLVHDGRTSMTSATTAPSSRSGGSGFSGGSSGGGGGGGGVRSW